MNGWQSIVLIDLQSQCIYHLDDRWGNIALLHIEGSCKQHHWKQVRSYVTVLVHVMPSLLIVFHHCLWSSVLQKCSLHQLLIALGIDAECSASWKSALHWGCIVHYISHHLQVLNYVYTLMYADGWTYWRHLETIWVQGIPLLHAIKVVMNNRPIVVATYIHTYIHT